MQSVSDDDVRKRLLEKPRFELQVVKGVFRLGRCYIFWQSIPGLRASNRESTATDGWSLDRWHQKTIGDICMWQQRQINKPVVVPLLHLAQICHIISSGPHLVVVHTASVVTLIHNTCSSPSEKNPSTHPQIHPLIHRNIHGSDSPQMYSFGQNYTENFYS